MIKKRRTARHRWQRTRDPADKTLFNRINKETKELIAKINNKSFENFVYSLDATADTNFSLWEVAKVARKPPSYVPPLRVTTDVFVHSDYDKTAAFASHLENMFQPNNIDSDIHRTIHNTSGPPLKRVSPAEVYNTIKKLKPRKAPSLDLITANILCQCPRKVHILLTYIYNASFRLHYFPNQWKIAKVILIPKSGKPADELTS
ncbi:hypothetical protein PGB90_001435 [Kerria lacca]